MTWLNFVQLSSKKFVDQNDPCFVLDLGSNNPPCYRLCRLILNDTSQGWCESGALWNGICLSHGRRFLDKAVYITHTLPVRITNPTQKCKVLKECLCNTPDAQGFHSSGCFVTLGLLQVEFFYWENSSLKVVENLEASENFPIQLGHFGCCSNSAPWWRRVVCWASRTDFGPFFGGKRKENVWMRASAFQFGCQLFLNPKGWRIDTVKRKHLAAKLEGSGGCILDMFKEGMGASADRVDPTTGLERSPRRFIYNRVVGFS